MQEEKRKQENGPDNKLRGKSIVFLGSSVTYGSAAGGKSFVEYLEETLGFYARKEAVSGTLLVEEDVEGGLSYITRMKALPKGLKPDLFVCQLSTNDAGHKKPLGKMAAGFALEEFSTDTVAGAIEYIIAYVKARWHCPVVFYTGSRYDSEAYGRMVELLHRIRKKWDIGVIDLWNHPMNEIDAETYARYMADPIHPTWEGYRDWWAPVIGEALQRFVVEKEGKCAQNAQTGADHAKYGKNTPE